jgi:hypothetical protein
MICHSCQDSGLTPYLDRYTKCRDCPPPCADCGVGEFCVLVPCGCGCHARDSITGVAIRLAAVAP